MPAESPFPVSAPISRRGERVFTFLFTDIERSTSLWIEEPEGMRSAVEDHDHALRPLFTARNGHVFRALGDAFYVAFDTVSDALRAALAAQITLSALTQGHPDRPEVRVRMAIHTGEAQPRDGDYFGLALSRAARLRDAAHGGQVVVTAVAAQLAGEGMPTGAALRDLGTHSLRDFPVAESIFQLTHPGLTDDFPPLRTGTATPHNLPRQLTSFVGRESEVRQIQSLLRTAPLVTLTGAGGCGKTRLSLEVAGLALEDFPGGVWFADLSSVRDEDLIEQTVAAAIGVRSPPGRTSGEGLRDRLCSGGASLLILDNCEQIVNGCAFFAESLLQDCPHLRLLATSREALSISGETVWAVPTLRVPEKTPSLTLSQLLQSEAVRLFVERARAASASFAPKDEDVPYLLSICQQLDGIPLALEIVASWSGVLRPRQIAERIEDRFKLLRAAGGSRTALPRQRTLRGAIEWSYDLLTEGERALLRRLSVFRGGWTLEAAEAVCGKADSDEDILVTLSSLAKKSLVVVQYEAGETRFSLLETIRQFALETLENIAEIGTIFQRHRAYYVSFAEEGHKHLTGAEQQVWLDRLEAEHDNFRAILASKASRFDKAFLASHLYRLWRARGYVSEGCYWLNTLFDNGISERFSENHRVWAGAANAAGILSMASGQYTEAQKYYSLAAQLFEACSDNLGAAGARANLGILASFNEDWEAATKAFEESIVFYRQTGAKVYLAQVLSSFAAMAIQCKNWHLARLHISEAISIQREIADHLSLANSLHNLTELYIVEGSYEHALAPLRESLRLRQMLGEKNHIAHSLATFAQICSQTQQWEKSVTLFGSVEVAIQTFQTPLTEEIKNNRTDLQRQMREKMGEERFRSAWQNGTRKSLEESIEFALEES